MKHRFSALQISILVLFSSASAVCGQGTNVLKEISPGVFEIGSVRLNKQERTVQFPAVINMTNGLVEYFLVSGTGKLHESVLKTETDPAQIHFAMLLLGAQEAGTNRASTNISGNDFTLQVTWKNSDSERKVH